MNEFGKITRKKMKVFIHEVIDESPAIVGMRGDIGGLKKDVNDLKVRMAIVEEEVGNLKVMMVEMKEDIDRKFDQVFTILDRIVGEMETYRLEHLMVGSRLGRHDEKFKDLELRLKLIEGRE